MLAYERLTLSYYAYQPVELAGQHVISKNRRVREPSIVTYRKHRALEEVSRQLLNGSCAVRNGTSKPLPCGSVVDN